METKPLNRIKVVMAERMVSNKELTQGHCYNIKMGNKHLAAQSGEPY